MSKVTEQLEVFKGEKIAVESLQDLPDRCIVETEQGLALLEREEMGFRFWLGWLGSFQSEGTALTAANGRVYLNKGMETYPGEVFATRGGIVVVREGQPGAPSLNPVSSDYEERITAALHEIADDNDWCREFDELMDEVGLPTRVRDMVSTISVEVVVTLGNRDAASVHQSLNEGELPDVSISEVEVKGDVHVEYYWRGLDDDDPEVDDSDVSRLVDELLPDHYVEIVDWDVMETRPDGQ